MQKKKIEKQEQSCGIAIFYIVVYVICASLISFSARMQSIDFEDVPIIISTAFNGIVTQFQTICIIALCNTRKCKKRYNMAYFLCAFSFLTAFVAVIVARMSNALPGLIIPITNALIVFFLNRYNESTQNSLIDLQNNQERLQQMIYYDSLTGLPNRKMIIEQLNLMIQRATKENMNFYVVFIDLDNFKQINDIYGHDIGDEYLIKAAQTIQKLSNTLDVVGRFGGDEFILIIQRNLKESEVYKYIDDLRVSLVEEFYMINENRSTSSASFGIASFPQDGKDAMELLKYADTAMYSAKNLGKNAIIFFNQELYQNLMHKFAFEHDLSMAISNQELHLVYQPQYTTQQKELRGFEVLLRWESPLYGKVAPDQFIPVSEQTGTIVTIGEWVLRESCKKIKEITQLEGYQNTIMSVNLSVVQIIDEGFLSMVDRVLEETGVNTNNLEFEVTESVFISSLETVTMILKKIRQKGIRVALDDFGTGYSSLNYLQILPITTLKIDKSFVDGIGKNESSGRIIGSLISMIHQLGMDVVAEGVEQEEQKDYLLENTCDFIQGYLWSEPLTENEIDTLCMENN